jgi:soluble lytic murein transglycosylase-like protein
MWTTPEEGKEYQILFEIAGTKYNVPPELLSRQCFQESSYNEKAHNKGSNAQGLMQIVPRWHPECKDPFDPTEAIPYGAKYLAELKGRFGTWDKALAAYNWGPAALSKALKEHGDEWLNHVPLETKNYVIEILRDVGI